MPKSLDKTGLFITLIHTTYNNTQITKNNERRFKTRMWDSFG